MPNGMKESIQTTAPYRTSIDNPITSLRILGSVGIESGGLFEVFDGEVWKEEPESLAYPFRGQRNERTYSG